MPAPHSDPTSTRRSASPTRRSARRSRGAPLRASASHEVAEDVARGRRRSDPLRDVPELRADAMPASTSAPRTSFGMRSADAGDVGRSVHARPPATGRSPASLHRRALGGGAGLHPQRDRAARRRPTTRCSSRAAISSRPASSPSEGRPTRPAEQLEIAEQPARRRTRSPADLGMLRIGQSRLAALEGDGSTRGRARTRRAGAPRRLPRRRAGPAVLGTRRRPGAPGRRGRRRATPIAARSTS